MDSMPDRRCYRRCGVLEGLLRPVKSFPSLQRKGGNPPLVPAIGCILGKKASRWSSFLVVAQSNAGKTTSRLRSNGGKTTNKGRSNRKRKRKRKKRNEHGFDARF